MSSVIANAAENLVFETPDTCRRLSTADGITERWSCILAL